MRNTCSRSDTSTTTGIASPPSSRICFTTSSTVALVREATALVERAELSVPDRSEPIVLGFRRDGCASLYFTADEAYHFNTLQQLRRAFVAGRLFKAEAGQLVALERRRSGGEVQLVRHELSASETDGFLAALTTAATRLREQLSRRDFHLIGQVPDEANVAQRMLRWLEALPSPPTIAQRPNVQ